MVFLALENKSLLMEETICLQSSNSHGHFLLTQLILSSAFFTQGPSLLHSLAAALISCHACEK